MRKLIFTFCLLLFCFVTNSQSFDTLSWQALGPFYSNLENNYKHVGRIESIWVNPDDTSEILIGTPTSGLWQTFNGGKNWTCLTDTILCGVNDILVDKNKYDNIYIATGLYVNGLQKSGYYGNGVLYSDDRGKSWKILEMNIEPEDKVCIVDLEVEPGNNKVIYALARYSLYKSENEGKTWSKLKLECNENSDEIFFNLSIKNSDPKILIVSGKNTLLISKNGGKKWENIYSYFCSYRTRISTVYGRNDTLYALCSDSTSKSNLIKKSSDDGLNWSEKQIYLSSKNYIMSLWSFADSLLFVGGIYLYKSVDYGNKFSSIHGHMHMDVRAMCMPDESNPNLIYACNDGGIEKSVDGGKTWSNLTGNLNINQSYSIGICQIDTNFLTTGAHDNGTYYRDTSGIWYHIFGGDGGTTLISSKNPEVLFFTYNESSWTNALKRRENAKVSKNLVSSYLSYDFPVIQSASDENIIYAASFLWDYDTLKNVGTILKSEDNGLTFGNVKEPFGYGVGLVSAMAECDEFPENFYFATYDQVNSKYGQLRRTKDGGKTWETVSADFFNSLISQHRITDIEIHPSEPEKLWITLLGFSAKTKVLYSKNGGNDWINLTYNLENYPANEIEYYKPLDLLICGTDKGIFYFDDLKDEWISLGKGLPPTIISDIKINYIFEEIYISTNGKGLWKLKL